MLRSGGGGVGALKAIAAAMPPIAASGSAQMRWISLRIVIAPKERHRGSPADGRRARRRRSGVVQRLVRAAGEPVDFARHSRGLSAIRGYAAPASQLCLAEYELTAVSTTG